MIFTEKLNDMKKTLTTILAAVAFIGLFAEKADGSMPVLWTFGCIAVLAICARSLERQLSKEK